MSMCVCTCMYVYMYACMYVRMYVCMYVCMYLYTYLHLGTPKVSVVERILQVTVFLEKNIAYPLTFLFGLNLTANYYLLRYGHMSV